jgi:lipopolysaccharide/colanic/teichoic acid biosynthesis glycosyltransferase
MPESAWEEASRLFAGTVSITKDRQRPVRSSGMEASTAQRRGLAEYPHALATPAVVGEAPYPPIQITATRKWFLDAPLRALDVTLSALLLVVLLPLLALIALAVRIDSRGPVLFRQRRVGRGLEPFTVNKFRTMHDGVGHDTHRAFVLGLIAGEQPERPDGGPRFKLVGDERVTRLGRVLRQSSLDELPQLWNVLRGDMSLVGPRPPIPYEVEHYPAHWFARFAVKPGLTGLWQVSGRSDLTLEQMIALDVEYSERRSLWLNLSILARTVPAVLSGKGAS